MQGPYVINLYPTGTPHHGTQSQPQPHDQEVPASPVLANCIQTVVHAEEIGKSAC